MIRKTINELQGNEILARSLMTWDYQIILPKGTVLRKDYIEKICGLGILEVYVEDEKSSEITILKSDTKDYFWEKVKDVLERHTYQNNQELIKLRSTADRIISTILEEDQVVDKIFDIKERSTDIYEHSVSICATAILTALKMQVDMSKVHDIGVGCLLHDIGLRYISQSFHEKGVEKLNHRELAEYKKHPVYGYSSLKDEDWISDLSKYIILYHHERKDGSGFPLHMKEYPFECEIVNVCDAFDEMICGIGCKKVKIYEAIEYLKNFKNIKFDGKIVDVFLTFTAPYPTGSRVITNEGELAVVIRQNKNFQDRPVIRILEDDRIIDLVEVHHVFIDQVLE